MIYRKESGPAAAAAAANYAIPMCVFSTFRALRGFSAGGRDYQATDRINKKAPSRYAGHFGNVVSPLSVTLFDPTDIAV
jgi:hypothetical protein